MLRTDNGPEFANDVLAEFCALIGLKEKFGTPFRLVEQGKVERIHQEKQKLLGIILKDVLQAGAEYWGEALVVVEFLLYSTPGQFGYTPRDIDRRWSLAAPLGKELRPFQVGDFDNLTGYAKNMLRSYQDIRSKVRALEARASAGRADKAHKFRRPRELVNGKLAAYRDPRAIAAGGRTQWREPLPSPCVIENAKQNKCSLRKPDGTLLDNCHIEDILLLPEGSMDLETKKVLVFEEEDGELVRQERKSLGELMEEPPDEGPPGLKKHRAKVVGKLRPGVMIAYRTDKKSKVVLVGKIRNITSKEAQLVVQKYKPVHDKRIRIKWMLVFVAEGQEVLGSGGKPVEESVPRELVLDVVTLQKGVLNQSAARKLGNAGYHLQESQPGEDEEGWGRFPLEKEFVEEEIIVDADMITRSWIPAPSCAQDSSKQRMPVHNFIV